MLISARAKETLISIIQLKLLNYIGATLYFIGKVLFHCGRRQAALTFLLSSIRCSYSPAATRLVSEAYKSKQVDFFKSISAPVSHDEAEARIILLSPPKLVRGVLVKGVILVKFTPTFSYVLKHKNWDQLNSRFAFILEPSWSGYADFDILCFLDRAKHCIIQASELRDRAFINSLFPHVPALDIGSSNWVDYERFTSSPNEKTYDCIYIANLNPIKRVYRAISAFVKVSRIDPSFKAIIICASWGSGSLAELQRYINARGFSENILVKSGMAQKDLVEIVQKSKCSILASLKEGSNRVLFESMFCDIPVICLSENIGVNKSYINEETGLLVPDKMLPEALLFMSNHYTAYSPREWALANISPKVTTERLAKVLKQRFGNSVNSELQQKVNTPEANYRFAALSKQKISSFSLNNLESLSTLDYVEKLTDLFNEGNSTKGSDNRS